MKLGTKILLLMLLITIGTSALLAWVVTLNVRRYETMRAQKRITSAIDRYVSRLEDRHRQVRTIVRNLVEAPAVRSQLQAAESGDEGAREQLRQEILGRTVQMEIASTQGAPAFHLLLNQAGESLLSVAMRDERLAPYLAAKDVHWPIDSLLAEGDELISTYVFTPAGLYLAMGVPLRTQLDEPPTNGYFAGFLVDDEWIRRQLLDERGARTMATADAAALNDAPLSAWFIVNGEVVSRASADPNDLRVRTFDGQLPAASKHSVMPASRAIMASDDVSFETAGERYLGQSFDLRTADSSSARLILASSLDQALVPLRQLQKQILWCTLVACAAAIIACQWLARRISGPIGELLEGTQRIAAGDFDDPMRMRRSDEFGQLAHAFNTMSRGLKERDVLRDEHTKIERDLALARKIQMDVLPKQIPPLPGYDIAAYSLPAEATGGDIYDLVAVARDRAVAGSPPAMILLLADATGHGIGPALSVTQVRAMLRMGLRLRAGLDDVFRQINRQLCQDLGAGRFVTAFLGLLDPSAHSVKYQSAGQAPLLHVSVRGGTLSWLESSTIPLGIDADDDGGDGAQKVVLEPGDLFVLLTDGFYEFQNPAGELFGSERIGDVVRSHQHRSTKEILEAILSSIRAFGGVAKQLDDMTALIIKREIG